MKEPHNHFELAYKYQILWHFEHLDRIFPLKRSQWYQPILKDHKPLFSYPNQEKHAGQQHKKIIDSTSFRIVDFILLLAPYDQEIKLHQYLFQLENLLGKILLSDSIEDNIQKKIRSQITKKIWLYLHQLRPEIIKFQ